MAERPALPGQSPALHVTLVTPRGAVTATDVETVVAPGVVGELGVLPGHLPLLSALKSGVLILGAGPTRQVFATGPGYLEVTADGRIEVLVEQAVPVAKLDAAAAKADLDKVQAELKAWDKPEDADWKNLQARLAWAQAQLDAVQRAAA